MWTNMVTSWKRRARQIRVETYALYLAYRDPRVPWYARVLAACVVGYAFSPLDLIPDFVPVLGYLDDLILIPLGILLVQRLVPGQVMDEYRVRAVEAMKEGKPVNKAAAGVIIAIWLSLAVLTAFFMWSVFSG